MWRTCSRKMNIASLRVASAGSGSGDIPRRWGSVFSGFRGGRFQGAQELCPTQEPPLSNGDRCPALPSSGGTVGADEKALTGRGARRVGSVAALAEEHEMPPTEKLQDGALRRRVGRETALGRDRLDVVDHVVDPVDDEHAPVRGDRVAVPGDVVAVGELDHESALDGGDDDR